MEGKSVGRRAVLQELISPKENNLTKIDYL